jgi:CheY-like chemotaxis protein
MRILFADDDARLRDAVVRLLRRDHEVVACGDAIAAFALIEAGESFDALITDYHMPGPSGAQLIALLRRKSIALAERALIITGGADRTSVQLMASTTATPVLLKPFTYAALSAALAALPPTCGHPPVSATG